MARVVDTQTNPWGKTVDAQRADLWFIDFTQALTGIKTALASATQLSTGLATPYVPPRLASYFASSVTLPELKVKSDQIKRDSRPYNMPGQDEALDAVRVTFLLDGSKTGTAGMSPYRSDVYQLLDVWRACVRAGRGGMSTEFALTLDGNYRIDCAFDVGVYLLTPTLPALSTANAFATAALAIGSLNVSDATRITNSQLNGDLIVSMQYKLVNCWLSSFKLSELTYEGTKMSQIEALFYADDIAQAPQSGD